MNKDNGAINRRNKQKEAEILARDFDASVPRINSSSVRAIPVGTVAEIAFVREMNFDGLSQSLEMTKSLNSRATTTIAVIPGPAIMPLIQQLQACLSTIEKQPGYKSNIIADPKMKLVDPTTGKFTGGTH